MDKPRSTPGILQGFFYPYKGFMFIIRNPGLLSYVAIPAVINTLLYSLFLWYTSTRIHRWIESLIYRGEEWYWAILFYLAMIVAALLILVLVVYTFTIAGSLILSPFNDLLSEKVDTLYSGGTAHEPFRLKGIFKDMARSVKAELGRIAIYLSGLALLLALNLFPPIGTAIYGVAITLFTMYFIGWEYFDYSLERNKFPFRKKLKFNIRNGLTLITFGAGAALALMVPVLNLAAIPVCVTGATLLFCDLKNRREDKS
ncbi:MAG: sulfate transporter CysZ [Deltaproteobacteria bacterium]|nr:sulfate transporter CysZ [Deltaproteobacteria bacterium]